LQDNYFRLFNNRSSERKIGRFFNFLAIPKTLIPQWLPEFISKRGETTYEPCPGKFWFRYMQSSGSKFFRGSKPWATRLMTKQ
jgi:hypothetical protein